MSRYNSSQEPPDQDPRRSVPPNFSRPARTTSFYAQYDAERNPSRREPPVPQLQPPQYDQPYQSQPPMMAPPPVQRSTQGPSPRPRQSRHFIPPEMDDVPHDDTPPPPYTPYAAPPKTRRTNTSNTMSSSGRRGRTHVGPQQPVPVYMTPGNASIPPTNGSRGLPRAGPPGTGPNTMAARIVGPPQLPPYLERVWNPDRGKWEIRERKQDRDSCCSGPGPNCNGPMICWCPGEPYSGTNDDCCDDCCECYCCCCDAGGDCGGCDCGGCDCGGC